MGLLSIASIETQGI